MHSYHINYFKNIQHQIKLVVVFLSTMIINMRLFSASSVKWLEESFFHLHQQNHLAHCENSLNGKTKKNSFAETEIDADRAPTATQASQSAH